MKKIAIKYGLMMFAGFVLFFLLMHAFGLGQSPEFRLFNGFIHLGFMYLAIREYRKRVPDSVGNYLSGIGVSFYSSLVGVGGFTLFMLFFFTLNPEFLIFVKESMADGLSKHLNAFTASLLIFGEGLAVTLIGSYIMTRVVNAQIKGWAAPESYAS